jgi:hypothetical protein
MVMVVLIFYLVYVGHVIHVVRRTVFIYIITYNNQCVDHQCHHVVVYHRADHPHHYV